MARTPTEEHLAQFLRGQKALGLTDYCRRCLNHIFTRYGEKLTRKVAAMIGEEWQPPPDSERSSGSHSEDSQS